MGARAPTVTENDKYLPLFFRIVSDEFEWKQISVATTKKKKHKTIWMNKKKKNEMVNATDVRAQSNDNGICTR